MKAVRISIDRLFNLGNFEHIKYSVSMELNADDSATVAMVGLEKIMAALNPKPPSDVKSEAELHRLKIEIDRMKAMTDEDFKHEFMSPYSSKGTRPEITDRYEKNFIEASLKSERWRIRRTWARAHLDDLGGAVKLTDVKQGWEQDDEEF